MKILTLITAAFVLSATSAFAHCGACKAGHSTKAKGHDHNLIQTAEAAKSFSTLIAAVKAAGHDGVLAGDGPYTVFAPTDEAFAKLPEGTVESLLKPENKDKLKSILTYHVVAGKVKAGDVVKLSSAKTVNGKSATIKTADGSVMIDGAKVIKTDIESSNGIIHVIDSVIIPAS